MKKVQILPSDVISKIAAGEVIERPASVLKELLENSLDAKSTDIEIHLKKAGKQSLMIRDNGAGIDKDDIETIFKRHATSKISSSDDLFHISSLGFRGEALYSVASISDISLTSRTSKQTEAWQIHIRGGETIDCKPAAGETGTEIEVNELFFNTPARKKFLKSDTAELNQILNILIPYTLLYPHCRFVLTNNGKTLLDLEPTLNRVNRISTVLKVDQKYILEANHDALEQNTEIHLCLGDINISRPRRDLQFIFINNRPVFSKSISYHLNSVYRLVLPPNTFPFFIARINIPPEKIDVNIHPTKREVKIKDESIIAAYIRSLCEHTLMTQGSTKQVVSQDTAPSNDFDTQQALAASSTGTSLTGQSNDVDIYEDQLMQPSKEIPTDQYAFPMADVSTINQTMVNQNHEAFQKKFNRTRYIGAFKNKYHLFESEDALFVVDQHAAQERITFELLIVQMQKGRVEVQRLLSPILIQFSPQEYNTWSEGKERLDEIGFESTQWDEESVAFHTYPVLLKNPDIAIRNLLSGGDIVRADHESIARRACRSSIMAGDPMTLLQAEYQKEQLLKCRDPFTCPHGRPTVIEMPLSFIDKQFLRT